MNNILSKKIIVLVFITFVVLSLYTYFYISRKNNEDNVKYDSVTMFMYIEEKDHDIEPGKYQKMWVTGFNANDDEPNKERYKVMIDDSRIYNLLEEGNEYFVLIQGEKENNQSEYTYTFGQLGLSEGTQLVGEGKIE